MAKDQMSSSVQRTIVAAFVIATMATVGSGISGRSVQASFLDFLMGKLGVTVTGTNTGVPGGTTSSSAGSTSSYNMVNRPVIDSINPTGVLVGSPSTVITITGKGFTTDSVVWISAGGVQSFNTMSVEMQYVTPTQLLATIPGDKLTIERDITVNVSNPGPTPTTYYESNYVTFVVQAQPNPVPHITSIDPVERERGLPPVSLRIRGTGINASTVARVGGQDRSTSYLLDYINGSYFLSMTFNPADLATAGTKVISLFNPAPGGGVSDNTMNFTVNNPAPSVTSLSPTIIPTNSPATTITITGTGFVPEASVYVALGSDYSQVYPATYVSSTQMTVVIPENKLYSPKVGQIRVLNPYPGGGLSSISNADSTPLLSTIFYVVAPLPVPQVTSVSPSSVGFGGPPLLVRVTGSNFVITGPVRSAVRFDGQMRETITVSTTELLFTVSAAEMVNHPAVHNIEVVNPAPGGGTSAPPAAFNVLATPAPTGTVNLNVGASGGNGTFSMFVAQGEATVYRDDVDAFDGQVTTRTIILHPGTYSISEGFDVNFATTSSCDVGTPASFMLSPGKTVNCTFNNVHN